jgi:Bardet-Biedl syndrome 2 protein
LGDMSSMRTHYTELMHMNRDLLGEYHKRSTNHEALLKGLKEVNRMIQLASRLRGGSVKTRIVSSCRAAIKENRIHDLLKIIVSGKT